MEQITKKELSTPALCAKAIKAELKTVYPTMIFKVTSKIFSGGSAVRIDWIDGPSQVNVQKITQKYQYGYFDGMTDSYNYDNKHNDLPQVKYVLEQRTFSPAIIEQIRLKLSNMYGIKLDLNTYYKNLQTNGHQLVYGELNKTSFC